MQLQAIMKAYKYFTYFGLLILLMFIYNIVLNDIAFSAKHTTDLLNHIRFAQKLLEYSLNHKIYFIPHPLFHILLILFRKVFDSWELAAVVLLLFTVIGVYNIQIKYIARELKMSFFDVKPALLSFTLLIVSSIYLPLISNWLSPEYFNVMFSGSGTPNVLHNPTYYLVKIFVLPIFLIFSILINEDFKCNIRYLVLFTILLSLSILAKPNFALTFIPSILSIILFKYIKFKESYLKVIFITAGLLLIPFMILLFQFLVSYIAGERDSTISVCFLCVWKAWSIFPPASILLGIGFPLFVFLINFKKNIKDLYYQLAWLNFLFSLLFAVFFYETNYRQFAGNFFWGYNLGLYLLFFVSVIDFVNLFHNREKNTISLKILIALALLLLHIAGGIYHLSIYLL